MKKPRPTVWLHEVYRYPNGDEEHRLFEGNRAVSEKLLMKWIGRMQPDLTGRQLPNEIRHRERKRYWQNGRKR